MPIQNSERDALYYSQEIKKKNMTLEETYKNDPKQFLKSMCASYEKHHFRKIQSTPSCPLWNCFGCEWDQKAYERAKFFKPFVAWHMNHERQNNLKNSIPQGNQGKEDRIKIEHACDLFIEAIDEGVWRDQLWCGLWATLICCKDCSTWHEEKIELI